MSNHPVNPGNLPRAKDYSTDLFGDLARDAGGKVQSHHLSMTLRPLTSDRWIEVDEHMPAELAEKRRLLAARREDVLQVQPEAHAAIWETLEVLVRHLPTVYPHSYERRGSRLVNRATGERWNLAQIESDHDPEIALETAARLVQEDLCVMVRDEKTGVHRLSAACVCFPTRWRLADKLGRSLAEIHGPVPHYATELESGMDRLFDRLAENRPVWRLNWGLLDDPALFQPQGQGRDRTATGITAQNAGDSLWLRIERQTLRRLPQSRAILFTIRVYSQPLGSLAAFPEQAAGLAASLRQIGQHMAAYKGLQPICDAVLDWLDSRSSGAR